MAGQPSHWRSQTRQNLPIPRLYAAGSDMASVMGGHYPAGGIDIGPAMTFGYIAGLHAAGIERAERQANCRLG